MSYFSQAFNPESLQHAKDIVLSSDASDPNKFEKETQWLINFIDSHIIINQDTSVLDFGCGMGRMSKALIDKFNCHVKGIDLSQSMLDIANQYVDNAKFTTGMSHTKQDIDIVLSTFVLQHSENPEQDISNIYSVMLPNSVFILVNEPNRFVPTGINDAQYVVWNDDKINVLSIMEQYFKLADTYTYYHQLPILTVWIKK